MTRQTQFSDVCGGMNELRRLAAEEPDRLQDQAPDLVLPMLEDARYMIGRMAERIDEYRDLAKEITRLEEAIASVEIISHTPCDTGSQAIHAWVRRGAPVDEQGVSELYEAVEEVRSVASAQENTLRRFKDLTLQLHAAFEQVRGERPWLLAEADRESHVSQLQRRYQAWLPPAPAGEILLDWMTRDRLTVQEGDRSDGQPVVLFDDGGAIPMSKIRWDANIRNFYPADQNLLEEHS